MCVDVPVPWLRRGSQRTTFQCCSCCFHFYLGSRDGAEDTGLEQKMLLPVKPSPGSWKVFQKLLLPLSSACGASVSSQHDEFHQPAFLPLHMQSKFNFPLTTTLYLVRSTYSMTVPACNIRLLSIFLFKGERGRIDTQWLAEHLPNTNKALG